MYKYFYLLLIIADNNLAMLTTSTSEAIIRVALKKTPKEIAALKVIKESDIKSVQRVPGQSEAYRADLKGGDIILCEPHYCSREAAVDGMVLDFQISSYYFILLKAMVEKSSNKN